MKSFGFLISPLFSLYLSLLCTLCAPVVQNGASTGGHLVTRRGRQFLWKSKYRHHFLMPLCNTSYCMVWTTRKFPVTYSSHWVTKTETCHFLPKFYHPLWLLKSHLFRPSLLSHFNRVYRALLILVATNCKCIFFKCCHFCPSLQTVP